MQSARVPNFKPSVNGFHFPNSFAAGIPLTTITIPIPGGSPITVPIGDASNGVCGGMVWAVLDFFTTQPRQHIPATTAVPGAGNPLTAYINKRLLDSFTLWAGLGSNAAHYAGLMTTLDHDTWLAHGVPYVIANSEWPKIKADIDAGRPSPLGLVPDTWTWPTNIPLIVERYKHSHQVLAYGYDFADDQTLTLYVYDPNDPDDDNSTIVINLANPTHTSPLSTPKITANIAGNHTFHAFFRSNDYSTVAPPAGLSSGPFILSCSVSPSTLQVDKPVSFTVTVKDAGTGASVAGTVFNGATSIGATNNRITTTFRASWVRQQHVDPRTHERSWSWSGPHYPVLSVLAPNYDRVQLAVTFTGGTPPPNPDA